MGRPMSLPTTLKSEGSSSLPGTIRVDIRRFNLLIEQGPDAGKRFGPLKAVCPAMGKARNAGN